MSTISTSCLVRRSFVISWSMCAVWLAFSMAAALTIMRYWEEGHSDWGPQERDYAWVWCSQPKWAVSRSLNSVGSNAILLGDDLEAAVRGLKARLDGEIGMAGPNLARSLGELGLIDEYRLCFCPVVLGRGTPFFAGARPPPRLVANDRIDDDVIRLT